MSGNALAGITSGGTVPVYTTVSRSTVRGNGGTGIFVSGGGTPSITRVTKSAIVRNVTGVGAGAGGSVLSRGNNTVEANNADGSLQRHLFREIDPCIRQATFIIASRFEAGDRR